MTKKISELDEAGAITGAELVPLVQDETTVKATVADLDTHLPRDAEEVDVLYEWEFSGVENRTDRLVHEPNFGSNSQLRYVHYRDNQEVCRLSFGEDLSMAAGNFGFLGVADDTVYMGTNETYLSMGESGDDIEINCWSSSATLLLKSEGDIQVDGERVGFYGATPVPQASAIADATGTDASTINAILAVLRDLGLIDS